LLPIKLTTITRTLAVIILLQGFGLLTACSSNGFHLRKNINLPPQYQILQIENIPPDNGLQSALRAAIQEAGGELITLDDEFRSTSSKPAQSHPKNKYSIIRINDFREGKRVVAYTKERKARIYLLFLKFAYEIIEPGKATAKKYRINLDKTFVYDANFALGKAEEERQIRDDLYHEAARLILLKLQYAP